ncbi:MAG: hypothetical protein JWR34_5545 [Mycobacterium sp.]|nr:hypothetical protein [Mycobacterium sp.]
MTVVCTDSFPGADAPAGSVTIPGDSRQSRSGQRFRHLRLKTRARRGDDCGVLRSRYRHRAAARPLRPPDSTQLSQMPPPPPCDNASIAQDFTHRGTPGKRVRSVAIVGIGGYPSFKALQRLQGRPRPGHRYGEPVSGISTSGVWRMTYVAVLTTMEEWSEMGGGGTRSASIAVNAGEPSQCAGKYF